MRKFNWKKAGQIYSVARFDFYKRFHNTYITEDAFINGMKQIAYRGLNKGSNQKYEPSKLKRTYWYLVNEYGFFTGKNTDSVFKECASCASKPGSPVLCGRCLVRRSGKCRHGKIPGRCVPCYEKYR